MVPYLAGERTPNRPEATGSLHGIRPDATPALVARAAFEGVVCGLLEGGDALTANGVSLAGGRMIVLGGGAHSAAYLDVLAGLAGRPVSIPSVPEPVARGAAVLAAAATTPSGVGPVLEAWDTDPWATVDPSIDPERARSIRRRYAESAAEQGRSAGDM